MRIAFVAPFGLQSKGTTRARALPLARALARRGHQVILLIPPYDSPQDSDQRWSDNGVDVVNVRLPAARWAGSLWHLILAWRLLCAVYACQPEAVHIFKPKGPSGLVGAALWSLGERGRWIANGGLSRARRSHSVMLIVDTDDWEGPGGWNDLAGYPAVWRWLFAWQEKWGVRHAHMVTAASKMLVDHARSLRVSIPDSVVYLPNGYEPLTRGTLSYPPVTSETVLWYTRFWEIEPAWVIDMWMQVHRAAPASQLLVVGRGLHGEERDFLKAVTKKGLGQAVEYLGWDEATLVSALLRSRLVIFPLADTLVNRARCPVKLAQVLGTGWPVVVHRVGEAASYVTEESGLLISPDEPEAFAEAVLQLLRDQRLCSRLAAGARARMQAEFSWDRLAAIVEGSYRGLHFAH